MVLNPTPSFVPVAMNLRVLMAMRGIRTIKALHDLLLGIGFGISHAQLSRLANDSTQGIGLDVIGALCDVLHCEPGDLFIRKTKISSD